MKFGVREICDVVLRAKATTQIGNKKFYKNEPVIYFDTLKTSSLEGASTTVYAQGGRGNARLMAWEGERTVTFTMEDALISTEGFMILSGAGLVEAFQGDTDNDSQFIYVHATERISKESGSIVASGDNSVVITLEKNPYHGDENDIYVFVLDEYGDVNDEPFIAVLDSDNSNKIKVVKAAEGATGYSAEDLNKLKNAKAILVDYYIKKASGASQIEITADSFGCNFYLEASTLFRNTDGVDLPAEFIIPNCKIQSNFTFTMASSGDPSTFTFTMDAFPDYTRWDPTKKVLAAIQIIDPAVSDDGADVERVKTYTHA